MPRKPKVRTLTFDELVNANQDYTALAGVKRRLDDKLIRLGNNDVLYRRAKKVGDRICKLIDRTVRQLVVLEFTAPEAPPSTPEVKPLTAKRKLVAKRSGVKLTPSPKPQKTKKKAVVRSIAKPEQASTLNSVK